MGRSVGTYVPFLRNGRRRPIVFLFVLFVHVVLEFFATGPLLSDALSLRAKAREEPAAGAGASGPDGDPYNIYFTKDKDMKNMRGGTTPQRNDADVEGYTPEARHEVRKWLHGPDNIRGKEHVHGCKSFPFCNHIPPPIGLTPPPWDIPAAMPNPRSPRSRNDSLEKRTCTAGTCTLTSTESRITKRTIWQQNQNRDDEYYNTNNM